MRQIRFEDSAVTKIQKGARNSPEEAALVSTESAAISTESAAVSAESAAVSTETSETASAEAAVELLFGGEILLLCRGDASAEHGVDCFCGGDGNAEDVDRIRSKFLDCLELPNMDEEGDEADKDDDDNDLFWRGEIVLLKGRIFLAVILP